MRREPDPDPTVPSLPRIEVGGASAAPRARKRLAVAAGLIALLGVGAGFVYLRNDAERASIEHARAEAERRAADAEERAKKESERADQEATARAKTEAARSEDQRREAEAAKARAQKEAEAKAEAVRREEALRREVEAKAEAVRREELLRREAEAAAARAAELARKVAEEKTKLAALRADEAKRKAALAKAEDHARAEAARKDAAKKAEDARKAERERAEQAVRDRYKAGTTLSDCADCPKLVVIAAGEFTMGSPATETGRFDNEGPQRTVRIARPFALGRSEITFADFQRFAQEAGYRTEAERDVGRPGCFAFSFSNRAATKSQWQPGRSWRNPGFEQTTERDPVVCVSWNDAKAYARWLSGKTGKAYRLPTEAEWEYAARAGTKTARPWGDDPAQACAYANVADQSVYRTGVGPGSKTWSRSNRHECNDGRYLTAPAGSYKANAFGLHDMLGNVWEWTEDCWNAGYKDAPADGSAWLGGDCAQRVIRGGSWGSVPRLARSAIRDRESSGFRRSTVGFRIARTLE